MVCQLATPRLRLRAWRTEDWPVFADLNADPQVMEFLPTRLDRQASDAMIARNGQHFRAHGFGLWAAEEKATGSFIGYIGLHRPDYIAHFTPCVEIGWRLARPYWDRGLATEGAGRVLEFGFSETGLDEIVSVTAAGNMRSRRVMEKLGMTRNPGDDFDHPKLPAGHALRVHVLYRKSRGDGLRAG